jgi:hypothetical protein
MCRPGGGSVDEHGPSPGFGFEFDSPNGLKCRLPGDTQSFGPIVFLPFFYDSKGERHHNESAETCTKRDIAADA